MERERGVIIRLYDDEHIVSVIRRHWLAMLQSAIFVFIFLIIFIVGVIIAYSSIRNVPFVPISQCSTVSSVTSNLGQGVLIVFGSIYLLSVLGYAFIAWMDYYLDLFIITNKRILRIEQAVLFSQKVSETSFQHVQDVSSQVRGLINSLLNVGMVYIETAGDQENFTFNFIKDPGGVAAEILELQKAMWDSEGYKGDLTSERKNVKIGLMNTVKPVLPENKIEDAPEPNIISNNLSENKTMNALIEEGVFPSHHFQSLHETEVKNLQEGNHYQDGRVITSYGVIWQSEQDLTDDVRKTLDAIDRGEDIAGSDW